MEGNMNEDDDEDDLADLVNCAPSPAKLRASTKQSSIKSVSDNDDEYTKMLIRQ